ncbi:sensor histidine kinase [Thiohalomonas denitrificans]|uniref:histidine kinase n=1 Tax=Thiohalomonas denitrificans TaxID=415747 RepID=A0A1G5R1D0_9GAMM|nr:PAS domain-containing sensor histidine kinase [Thiohalomonas denitrificans]SCZ67600.1 PAS domain S-box-containing protein [Thiohalomonas denitrificans]
MSERPSRMEEVRQIQQDFRTLSEHSTDIISRFDRAMRYLYVNPVIERYSGWPREAFIGKSNAELGMPRALVTLWNERIQSVFASGRTETFEFSFPAPQGECHFEARLVPEFGEDGRVATVLGVAHDITDRTRFEETLRRTAHDLDERVKEVSCLYTVASLTQQRSRALAEVLQGTAEALAAAYQYPEITCARITVDGHTEWSEPFEQTPWRQAVTFGANNRPSGVIEVFYREERPPAQEGPFLAEERAILNAVAELLSRSLQERQEWAAREKAEAVLVRKTKELERLNAELEEFAYVVSHDLKAPLRAVANLAYVIDEDVAEGLDEENRLRLRLLRKRVMGMDTLIDRLLGYARLDRSTQEREAVALGPLLDDLLARLTIPPGFRIELQEPLPTIFANPLHLRQVFQNLITNAIDHHDSSKGSVWIRAHDDGKHWRVEVVDDGPGIPAWAKERIFRMFSSGGKPGHTGIGLAVARKIVLSHGGQIEVADNSPRGTIFRTFWPK